VPKRVGVLLPLALSCLGSSPPRGSFFSLDRKETKDQGLELMLDKRVETLLATAARNEEKSFLPLFWFGRLGEDCAQVSTASPSIISYAG
jgi:hypothetical protein